MIRIHDERGESEANGAPSEPLLGRVLDGVAQACMIAAGVGLVFLIVTFGWLVYGRYILNDTPTWVEQTSLLMIAYITFLGAAAGVRNNTHLSIDFVREALPRLPRLAMRFASDAFIVVFGWVMAWQGWQLVTTNLDRAIPMIDLSESWRALPVAICGVLMIVFAGYNIVMRIVAPDREDA